MTTARLLSPAKQAANTMVKGIAKCDKRQWRGFWHVLFNVA